MMWHDQVAKAGYFQWQSNPIKWGTKFTLFLTICNKIETKIIAACPQKNFDLRL